MALKHEIEVIIGVDGQVRLEIHGLHGPGCVPALNKVAAELGQVTAQEKHSEYYQQAAQAQAQAQKKPGA